MPIEMVGKVSGGLFALGLLFYGERPKLNVQTFTISIKTPYSAGNDGRRGTRLWPEPYLTAAGRYYWRNAFRDCRGMFALRSDTYIDTASSSIW
jgi:hypothetical protein